MNNYEILNDEIPNRNDNIQSDDRWSWNYYIKSQNNYDAKCPNYEIKRLNYDIVSHNYEI